MRTPILPGGGGGNPAWAAFERAFRAQVDAWLALDDARRSSADASRLGHLLDDLDVARTRARAARARLGHP